MELLNATGAGELEHIKVKEYIKVEKITDFFGKN